MSNGNYLNFKNDQEHDEPIYRIMPISRLFEIIDQKKITLVKPEKWKDQYENIFFKSKVICNSQKGSLESIRKTLFGQCWTLHEETDAMWKNHSPDEPGVKVKTTSNKLLSALTRSVPKYPELSCFIGRVEYVEKSELKSKLSKIEVFESTGRGITRTLLLKTKAYEYENEVRLIYLVPNSADANFEFFPFPVEPSDLFEEIVFHPEFDSSSYEKYKTELLAMGFTNKIHHSTFELLPESALNEIHHSTLYEPETYTIELTSTGWHIM